MLSRLRRLAAVCPRLDTRATCGTGGRAGHIPRCHRENRCPLYPTGHQPCNANSLSVTVVTAAGLSLTPRCLPGCIGTPSYAEPANGGRSGPEGALMSLVRPRQTLWYLMKTHPFSHLPKAQLLELAKKLKPFHVRAGSVIHPSRPAANCVLVLQRGAVEIARVGLRGRKVALAVMSPGDVFAILGILEGEEWPRVATALEACELWRLPASTFRRLCRHHPGFTFEVARTLSGKALLFSAKIESLLFKSIPVRLAETLAALAERFGSRLNGGSRLDIALTQRNLADLIGASRQHVSSALARLAAHGLIGQPGGRSGRYEIPDLARLRATAEHP